MIQWKGHPKNSPDSERGMPLEIVLFPSLPHKRRLAWRKLVSADNLYQALLALDFSASRDWQPDFEELQKWETRYLAHLPSEADRQEQTRRLAIVRSMLIAAEKANPPRRASTGPMNEVWVQTFLERPVPSCRVPIALYVPESHRGVLATLEVDVFPKGSGQMAVHPANAFTPYDDTFLRAMNCAWRAACNACGSANVNARYRLCLDEAMPEKISGASASGAAAWGWHHALRGQHYDRRVIVLAQVDERGLYHGVDGIEAKVEAIAQQMPHHGIDTVVVASQANHDEASRTLQRWGYHNAIRVELLT